MEGEIIVQRDQGRSSRSKAKTGQTPGALAHTHAHTVPALKSAWLIWRVRECAVQRQTVPLAVKALKAAVQELMVMAEQKEGGGEDDGSDDSDVDEYQDDMKALMVRHRLMHHLERARPENVALLCLLACAALRPRWAQTRRREAG